MTYSLKMSLQSETETAAALGAELLEAERQEISNPERAEKLYRKLLRANPGHVAVFAGLAAFLIGRGQLDEGIALQMKAVAAEPANADLHNTLGVALHSSGSLPEAELAYRRAIELDSSHADAHYNLGALLEAQERLDQALAAYRSAVALRPSYAKAWVRIGALLHGQDALEDALTHLDKAVQAAPRFFDAQYYRGTVLSGLRRHDEALVALRNAAMLRPDSFEVELATANALRDAGRNDQALEGYWKLLERQPERADTHQEINQLAWSSGRKDLYLRSFEFARSRRGADPDLLTMEAGFRLRNSDAARAEDLLWKAHRLAPERDDVLGLLARALVSQGRFEEAYPFYARAIALAPGAMLHRQDLGLALLRDGQTEDARQVFEQARELMPHDQIILAGLSSSYRLLGDARYAALVDPQRYVSTFDIAVPAGFRDAAAFNQALAEELDTLHSAKVEPIDQSLRGGTQTTGHLFSERLPMVQALKASIREAIAEYIRDLPQNPLHPMSQRRAGDFDFTGSWSCRLQPAGFHANHVHPEGWISSAYYARVPEDSSDGNARPGWLRFGETNLALGGDDRPELFVRPLVGQLVLFPSYYWHGTVPFADSRSRLAIAFDAVPVASA